MAQRNDADASSDLLLALTALRCGLVDQDKILVAFKAWTRAPGRSMAEILASQGALDARGLTLLEDLVKPASRTSCGPRHRTQRSSRRRVAAQPVAETVAYLGPHPLHGGEPAGADSPSTIAFASSGAMHAGGWARSSSRSIPSWTARSRSRSCGPTTRTTRSARRGSCSRPG